MKLEVTYEREYTRTAFLGLSYLAQYNFFYSTCFPANFIFNGIYSMSVSLGGYTTLQVLSESREPQTFLTPEQSGVSGALRCTGWWKFSREMGEPSYVVSEDRPL